MSVNSNLPLVGCKATSLPRLSVLHFGSTAIRNFLEMVVFYYSLRFMVQYWII